MAAEEAPRIPLTYAGLVYDRLQPLHSGEVQPKGIDLTFAAFDHPKPLFDRMLRNHEFDASEMSLSSYICRYVAAKRAGRTDAFVALPVFPCRTFRHAYIAVNGARINSPADLAGKRIGVQAYPMTAAVWLRALLQDQLGVDLGDVTWVEGAMERPGPHGDPTTLPTARGAGVRIEPNESGKSLSDLLVEGGIDATVSAELPSCCLRGEGGVRRLFADPKAAEKAYFRETGIFPIAHVVVVRREVLERHPWVAGSLYAALDESKEVMRQRMRFQGAPFYMLPWLSDALAEVDEVFGGQDPFVYGVEANRKTLEGLVKALYDQGMIDEKPSIEELFA